MGVASEELVARVPAGEHTTSVCSACSLQVPGLRDTGLRDAAGAPACIGTRTILRYTYDPTFPTR